MSHFSVLVTGDHTTALQPFHEFECTGINDQFVQAIDETVDHRAAYDTTTPKVHQSFREYIENGEQIAVIKVGETPDLEGTHKFMYAVADETGEIISVFNRTNSNRKWDWHQVGGRFSGKLLTKQGARVDQALASDIDWDAIIASKSSDAGAIFDKIHTVLAGRDVVTWKQTLARKDAGEFDIEGARNFYNGQPIIEELKKAEAIDAWYGADILSSVLASADRASYIKREGEVNATTFAFLHGGKWYERGEMGWFGMSTDTPESTSDYVTQFWNIVRALPADTQLTVVDCHI